MNRTFTLSLIPLLCAAAYAQSPEPPHIVDPNLTLGESEGPRMLVLPKSVTQLTFTSCAVTSPSTVLPCSFAIAASVWPPCCALRSSAVVRPR